MNIAIKLPNDLRERVLTFPFLQVLEKKLTELLEDDEILNFHLISLKEDIDVLNLLPVHAFYHELEVEDIKTIFTMHRACGNFKMNQIDYFVSTTDSFVDASIGKNIGAVKKIGYNIGKNKWFLNQKVSKLAGRHKSEQTFELLKCFTEEVPSIPVVYSRNMPEAYADWNENPYTVINLDLIGDEFNPEWKEFIDLFVNKNFIFMCSELSLDDQKQKIQEFIKSLPTKNTYKIFEYGSNIAFGKLISYCLGFITNDSPLVNIAAYCGAQVFLINKKEDLQNCGPLYFIGEVRNFSITDPAYKGQKGHNYATIFDDIYSYIEQRSQPDETDQNPQA